MSFLQMPVFYTSLIVDECVKDERTRCIQAINNTLASWRCVPSQHIREFAELCIKAIEEQS